MSEIEFKTKVAAVAPAEINLEVAALIGNKRQPTESASAERNIPPFVRIKHSLGVTPDSLGLFVGNTYHIEGEVVAEIPKPPMTEPMSLHRPVFLGRIWSVNVPEPPDGV